MLENIILAVLLIFSKSVYEQNKPLWRESLPVSPDNSYAIAKYASEILLESIFRGSETQYTSIRLASLLGPTLIFE